MTLREAVAAVPAEDAEYVRLRLFGESPEEASQDAAALARLHEIVTAVTIGEPLSK